MEVQKVKDIYFKLTQERDLVPGVDLYWIMTTAVPYLNQLVSKDEQLKAKDVEHFLKSLRHLVEIVNDASEQSSSIISDVYLTRNSKSNLLEDLTKQRQKEAVKANEKLKGSMDILNQLASISFEASRVIDNISKNKNNLGEPTIYRAIYNSLCSSIGSIKADKYVLSGHFETVEQAIENATAIVRYQKPTSPKQIYGNPNLSSDYHQAIQKWLEKNHPHLLLDSDSYDYELAFKEAGSEYNLTAEEFKVKIYLDYIEWRDQQLIDMRLKEEFFAEKDATQKQDSIVDRFRKVIGL